MTTAEASAVGARAELQAWYLGRLRPRLADAVTAGAVEAGAMEALDLQLGEFFGQPEEVRQEVT